MSLHSNSTSDLSVLSKKSRPSDPLTIVIIGASGDLAKKKTYPALFSLYYHSMLPENIKVYGFGRSKITDEDFRSKALSNIHCRVNAKQSCAELVEKFSSMCFYRQGAYDDPNSYVSMYNEIIEWEESVPGVANRLFYLAVPPEVFVEASRSITKVFNNTKGWLRTIVEKPFGEDLASYKILRANLAECFDESQIFRIDHYLGKEIVQNLMIFRFGNSIFEPLWNRENIKSIQIIFKEEIGAEGRVYFDGAGIIRDIIQNHLLQVFALVAMEPPASNTAFDIRTEKFKILKQVHALQIEDLVLGQYTEGNGHPSYKKEIKYDSNTPTFAAGTFRVNNRRWQGVPFHFLAGKGLESRTSEVRILFKEVPGDIFNTPKDLKNNELVIRIQPDEAIYFKIMTKEPGVAGELKMTRMNLFLQNEFSTPIPDAYEPLILDAIRGDSSMFMSDQELSEAWRIVNDALLEFESRGGIPVYDYPFGSFGPEEANAIPASSGEQWRGRKMKTVKS